MRDEVFSVYGSPEVANWYSGEADTHGNAFMQAENLT